MHQRGLSLIELLIVMALMGLVLSLVGPLGLKQIERSEAVYESMQLQQLLDTVGREAFISATPVTLHLQGKLLTVQGAERVLRQQDFSHVFFPEQQVQFNLHGYPNRWQVNALVRGQSRTFTIEQADAPH